VIHSKSDMTPITLLSGGFLQIVVSDDRSRASLRSSSWRPQPTALPFVARRLVPLLRATTLVSFRKNDGPSPRAHPEYWQVPRSCPCPREQAKEPIKIHAQARNPLGRFIALTWQRRSKGRKRPARCAVIIHQSPPDSSPWPLRLIMKLK